MTVTCVLLIILAVCIIPPIINMLFLYITVKFNLWTWISRWMFSEDYDDRINPDDVKMALTPFASSVFLVMAIAFHVGTAIYYIVSALMFPFIKLLSWINRTLVSKFERIEDKREFYKELNNHCKK